MSFQAQINFKFFCRNIPHEAIQYAENALLAGAVTGRIIKQLHIYYNCLLE
jgi:hypothetical protein